MTFKIKDGIKVGQTDVFNDSGTLLVNAPTASKWLNQRTITLAGDLSGSVSIDGSGDVTLTATVLEVTGGGDTPGFISTITAGTPGAQTGSSGLTISTTDTTTTIAHADTSTLTGAQGSAGIASITLDGFGHITAVTTANYLTAEADTLATVTGRGATTATAISLTNSTASTSTSTGALVVSGGVGVGGALNVGGNLSVTGNLTINGSTTTVNSTTVTIDDPIFTLGGDTAPTTDDNKDRGIEFRWHNGTAARVGFFGFDDSTGKFTFIPEATNTSEVFSGTKGTIDANIEWSDVLNKPDPVITLAGDLTGSVTLTDLASATLTATIAANSVALGTDTTGNYVASVAAGTSGAQSGSSGLTISGTGEGAAVTIAHADTSSAANLTATARTYVTGLTFDTYGHVTAYTTDTETVANTTSLPIENSAGTVQFTATDTTGLQFAGAGIATVAFDSGNQRVTITATEADTLATVTGRGNTTTSNIQINSGASLILASATAAVSEREAITTAISAANAPALHTVDSWPKATYRMAKYLVTVTQGTFFQTSEITVFNDGTTAGQMTEHSVFSTDSTQEILFNIDASGANVVLRGTGKTGVATAITYKIDRTLIVV